jgi:hypothetical protein
VPRLITVPIPERKENLGMKARHLCPRWKRDRLFSRLASFGGPFPPPAANCWRQPPGNPAFYPAVSRFQSGSSCLSQTR